jgi:hypothetical protein
VAQKRSAADFVETVMTQRKGGNGAHTRDALRNGEAPTDFDRPDADRAAHGPAPHEDRARSATDGRDGRAKNEGPTRNATNDAEHGYSQDSGYSGSGGPGGPADSSDRVSREGPRDEGPQELANQAKKRDGHGSSDEQIRSDLQQRLTMEGTRGSRLLISIGDGIVTLKGEVTSPAEQRRLVEIVRRVPSVREVREELRIRSSAPPN